MVPPSLVADGPREMCQPCPLPQQEEPSVPQAQLLEQDHPVCGPSYGSHAQSGVTAVGGHGVLPLQPSRRTPRERAVG